ncbi:hypothetical protein EJ02DRAFT_409417 [Clathrospora elynae]|uniref:ELYS-like domain-containing protein n=1 Tax=Clathrospora elynae TaxID=706981 RepID=A0A6A5SH95_9PLEO|nr:hypothetical protein EJ02DRAFT_409417 [Clathrospora elynae]
MLDVEDFDAVFRGLDYSDGLVAEIQEFRTALGGRTFFERLLDLLKIKGRALYPPKTRQQLHDLHQRIISSDTTLHNKHCLVFYLLKDLSPQHHESTELSAAFACDVHLEKRFWTFIEGLWSLDHLQFAIAVGHLTHPSIIPTFPDEIMHTLLVGRGWLTIAGMSMDSSDDVLALAYYNCVKPPLEEQKVRIEFARYLADRNVTDMYYWIHSRPEYEQKPLLEILVEETLQRHVNAPRRSPGSQLYSREAKAVELVSLPFTDEEEGFIEKFLTEGKGRMYESAEDTVMMRRMVTGRLTDVAAANKTTYTGARPLGRVDWAILKDGVKRGLGSRSNEQGLAV